MNDGLHSPAWLDKIEAACEATTSTLASYEDLSDIIDPKGPLGRFLPSDSSSHR